MNIVSAVAVLLHRGASWLHELQVIMIFIVTDAVPNVPQTPEFFREAGHAQTNHHEATSTLSSMRTAGRKAAPLEHVKRKYGNAHFLRRL
jgi:hypothetical protein